MSDSYDPALVRLERLFDRHRRIVRERAGNEIAAERERDDRLDVLEFNVARLLLRLRSVVEIAQRKNLFTAAELADVEAEIDLVQGGGGGGVAPDAVSGLRAGSPPASFFGFLRSLERSTEAPTPDAFLDELSRRAPVDRRTGDEAAG